MRGGAKKLRRKTEQAGYLVQSVAEAGEGETVRRQGGQGGQGEGGGGLHRELSFRPSNFQIQATGSFEIGTMEPDS